MLFVNGLKRSGNHVVIGWICENFHLDHENWINSRNQHYHYNVRNVKKKPYIKGVLYSYEDLDYDQFCQYLPSVAITIAIRRSVSNMVASRIVAFQGNPQIERPPFSDYEDEISADQCSGKFIGAEADLIHRFYSSLMQYDLVIEFDRFIESSTYRLELKRRINALLLPAYPFRVFLSWLTINSELTSALNKVSDIGFGSSFLRRGERETAVQNYAKRVDLLSRDQRQLHDRIVLRLGEIGMPKNFQKN
ncbi:hypothetical protein [Desulfosediminicola sp.]|uniref:hypothetical protein n=1 Tax=Desulfosediminicola sp. TaxID=2886825 RepID=UPI003AF2B6DA